MKRIFLAFVSLTLLVVAPMAFAGNEGGNGQSPAPRPRPDPFAPPVWPPMPGHPKDRDAKPQSDLNDGQTPLEIEIQGVNYRVVIDPETKTIQGVQAE